MLLPLILMLTAQPAEPAMPYVDVYCEAAGGRYLYLDLPEAPNNADALMKGLAEAFDLPDFADHIAAHGAADFDLPAGYLFHTTLEDGSWYGSMRLDRAVDLAPTLLRTYTFDLAPLRDPLLEAGYPAAHLSFSVATGAVAEVEGVTFDFPYSDDSGGEALLKLDEPLPVIEAQHGFTPAGLAGQGATLIGIALLPLLATFLVGRRLRRVPEEEIGWACLRGQQAYAFIASGFWIVWTTVVVGEDVSLPLAYLAPEFESIRQNLALAVAVPMGLIAMLLTQTLLHPILTRYPGATFTRRDLLIQALWLNLLYAVTLFGAPRAVNAMMHGLYENAGFTILFIAVAVAVCWNRYRLALGFRFQPLEEGDLLARARQIAERAGLDNVLVNLLYIDKAPLSNAFATTRNQVLLSETLINHLTRREIDAMVAHEIGHLRAKHPARIARAMFLTAILALVAAIPLAIGLALVLVAIPGLPQQFVGAPMFLVGLAVVFPLAIGARLHYRRLRRFEFEADAAAVELTGDPEALITGLAKLTRGNYMPFRWPSGKGWMTHPDTRERVDHIARIAGLDTVNADALLEVREDPADAGYTIPHSADKGRVLGLDTRTRLLNRVALAGLFLPGVVAGVAAYLGFRVSDTPGVAMILATIAVACLMYFLHNRAGRKTISGTRLPLLKRLRAEGRKVPDDALFVSHTPNDVLMIYGGLMTWDVGFLWLEDGSLHYAGDAISYSLSAADVRGVDTVRFRGGWHTYASARVQWRDAAGNSYAFCFGIIASKENTKHREALRALVERLSTWHLEHGDTTRANTTARPEDWSLQARPADEVIGPRGYLVNTAVATLVALFIGGGLIHLLTDALDLMLMYTPAVATAVAYVVNGLPVLLKWSPRRL